MRGPTRPQQRVNSAGRPSGQPPRRRAFTTPLLPGGEECRVRRLVSGPWPSSCPSAACSGTRPTLSEASETSGPMPGGLRVPPRGRLLHRRHAGGPAACRAGGARRGAAAARTRRRPGDRPQHRAGRGARRVPRLPGRRRLAGAGAPRPGAGRRRTVGVRLRAHGPRPVHRPGARAAARPGGPARRGPAGPATPSCPPTDRRRWTVRTPGRGRTTGGCTEGGSCAARTGCARPRTARGSGGCAARRPAGAGGPGGTGTDCPPVPAPDHPAARRPAYSTGAACSTGSTGSWSSVTQSAGSSDHSRYSSREYPTER